MLPDARRSAGGARPSLWGTLPADVRRWAAPIVGVEPCVWWQLKWRNPGALLPWTGAGAQRFLRTRQATSAGAARGGGPRAAAYGLVRGVARTRLRRVARIPGNQLAGFAPVGRGPEKGKTHNDYTTARTPCRPAARRRRDLKPPARRAARLDRAYGKCTRAAARTTVAAPPHLRRRPAARRRRRRGGLMKKHTQSRPHKYVEMRPGERAPRHTHTSTTRRARSDHLNRAAARASNSNAAPRP